MKSQDLTIPRARTSTDFARAIAEAAKARAKEAAEAVHRLPVGVCWVMGCNSDPHHVGIIFAQDVDPTRDMQIHGGKWFSSTHDISEPFFGTRDQVLCSQCLVETGAEMPLRVERVESPSKEWGFSFKVPPHWRDRFLHKRNVEELGAFMPPIPPNEPEPDPAELARQMVVKDPVPLEIPDPDEALVRHEAPAKIAGSALKGGAA